MAESLSAAIVSERRIFRPVKNSLHDWYLKYEDSEHYKNMQN